jgi:hypothetical protein
MNLCHPIEGSALGSLGLVGDTVARGMLSRPPDPREDAQFLAAPAHFAEIGFSRPW